ncbi:MAG: stage 0 sporulation family protein [Chloroflexi bacterium]|nr:stage 0 sporulation family protein [Chloroflexota bacterium]
MVTATGYSIVGVRFRRAGRLYFFDPRGLDLQPNDQVVVETEKGQEVGWVVVAPKQVIHSDVTEPLKPVLRKASPEDLARQEELLGKAREALLLGRLRAQRLGLPLKLVDTQYTLDGGRLFAYYTAEEKADYRPLIGALADFFHVRVELRQVGTRDETKLVGGIGRCGQVLCCALWLTRFDPVTIKMAKEQHLPISATNLAGQCGRLRCCLRFEYEQYRALNKALPRTGSWVTTPGGRGRVLVGHPLKETISVLLEESEAVREFPISQVTPEPHESGG